MRRMFYVKMKDPRDEERRQERINNALRVQEQKTREWESGLSRIRR